jgi:hypothetical protein
VINDALYRREAFLEEMYGIQVEHIVDSKALTTLGNHVQTNTDLCEALYMSGTDTMSAATSGYVLDVNTLEGLQLDQPWWDQRIQKEYRIGNHLFTLEGDMNMLDELRTICVVFNKTLYDNYGYNTTYGTPYDLVDQNKWTYDTLMEMIKGVTVDPTDANGRWGMLSEVSAPYYFFLGQGHKTLVNNGGEFVLNIESETISNALQKMIQLVKNQDVMIVNNGVWFGGNDVWTEAGNVFKGGNVLFRSNALSSVNAYIDMTGDYGILPVPKYDETQENYITVVGNPFTLWCVMQNAKDAQMSTAVIECMASEAYRKTSPMIFENNMKYRYTPDLAGKGDSARMFDIVRESIAFDLGRIFSDILSFMSEMPSKTAATSSSWASMKAQYDRTLKRSMAELNKSLDEVLDK